MAPADPPSPSNTAFRKKIRIGHYQPRCRICLTYKEKMLSKYPKGGTRAWLVTAGLAGVLFSTVGCCFAVFR
ncbi:uncharacterized protein BCR38DRAFT_445238 [Pseudomassariella vexata]|uniref:Uncharacterized protein n=1 Tax=Pseudomassariella vexata TaxID=1141098 RepID=A0A1Y2DK91_9PEZI|nr:uncharacterized protein BCR38DRAFT_445238 [Pseudomassariella vexata]ORY59687.1 hypothetical protein BCR38DRAFT_445238 [Pseudomassariella vexata]